jgi:hypothetical protein
MYISNVLPVLVGVQGRFLREFLSAHITDKRPDTRCCRVSSVLRGFV